MNAAGSETGYAGDQHVEVTGASDAPDEYSLLRRKLEVTRFELARANRRIAMLLRDQRKDRATIGRLETMATTDALTELVNRRRFNQVLELDFTLAVIRDAPLSVMMVDVDDFKWYNDQFGHLAGDMVLATFARHLVKSARPTDVVARYGGDEFAILLREADRAVAEKCAERYREAIASAPWPQRTVTASFGVASREISTSDAASLVREADRALYECKRRAVRGGVVAGGGSV